LSNFQEGNAYKDPAENYGHAPARAIQAGASVRQLAGVYALEELGHYLESSRSAINALRDREKHL